MGQYFIYLKYIVYNEMSHFFSRRIDFLNTKMQKF